MEGQKKGLIPYELTHPGGDEQYHDAYVFSELSTWEDGVTIHSWSSKNKEPGGTRKSLKNLKHLFGHIHVEDIGEEGDPSYNYWVKMYNEKLVDSMTDSQYEDVVLESLIRATVRKVIRETIQKAFIAESDDIDWGLYELLSDIKMDQMKAFHHAMMQEKPDDSEKRYLKARQEWNTVDFSMLKRQWEEYMKWGKVLPRYEKSIEYIEKIFTENILKVTINTELAGHEQTDPIEEWMEYFGDDMDEEEKKKMAEYMDQYFGDWIEEGGQMRISDYGLKPLRKLLSQLRNEMDPSKKLPILDKMLNVVHQRSDIASWFVEGGSAALSDLSGMEEEGFNA